MYIVIDLLMFVKYCRCFLDLFLNYGQCDAYGLHNLCLCWFVLT